MGVEFRRLTSMFTKLFMWSNLQGQKNLMEGLLIKFSIWGEKAVKKKFETLG